MPSKSIYTANSLTIIKENEIYFLRRNHNKEGGRRYYSERQANSLLTSIIHSYKQKKFSPNFHLTLSKNLATQLRHAELALE